MTETPEGQKPPCLGKPSNLWDDPESSSLSLGCWTCVDRERCGGAHKAASFFDCDDYCRCSNKQECDLVCRGNPASFVERLREVDGLDLLSVRRVRPVDHDALPSMVPLIEHNSARQGRLRFPIVALPLYSLIDFQTGTLKVRDREALASLFGIDPNARLIVSGVARDRKIERYWELRDRVKVLTDLQSLSLTLATPPNFSVLTDVPRTDNLHAMKRILLAWTEMTEAGLPAALHVNARTERDYGRWAEFVRDREEVQCLAVEFATGAGRGNRIEWHVTQLQRLAEQADRPLRLVMRGGTRVMERLRRSFRSVSLIDSDAFSKSRCRRRAYFTEAGDLAWRKHLTPPGYPIDDLLQQNVATLHSHHTYLERLHADRRLTLLGRHANVTENGNRKAV